LFQNANRLVGKVFMPTTLADHRWNVVNC
jgi:hypothetical protein